MTRLGKRRVAAIVAAVLAALAFMIPFLWRVPPFQVPSEPSDSTAPSSELTLTGDRGNNDWFKGPVRATIRATDDRQVSAVHYQLSGLPEQSVNGAEAAFMIEGDGRHSVRFWAIDVAGNREAVNTREVAIDILGVSVVDHSTIEDRSYWREVLSEEPNLNVTVRYSITTVSSLEEASSRFVREGIDGPETFPALNETMYNLGDNATFKPGTYRLEVEARNEAGHKATVLLAQFAIRDFIGTLSQCSFLNNGLRQSLTVKIQHALERLNAGEESTANNILKATRNEAQASSVEMSDPACAEALEETIDDRLGPESSSLGVLLATTTLNGTTLAGVLPVPITAMIFSAGTRREPESSRSTR